MPTQEDRIAALERKVAMLELLRSQDERKAEESISPVQVQNLREINENMTILLGVASSQEGDMKTDWKKALMSIACYLPKFLHVFQRSPKLPVYTMVKMPWL